MAEDFSLQWHAGFWVIVAMCSLWGSCVLQLWAPNHWDRQRSWGLKEFPRGPGSIIDFPLKSYTVLLKTLQWCLLWNCSFPPHSRWPVWNNKYFPRWMTLGPGIKTSLVSLKAFPWLETSFLHQRSTFFFTLSASKREMSKPSLSSVHNMVLTAAGFQVNKYSRTRK